MNTYPLLLLVSYNLKCAEGAGRDAQATVVAALDIQERQLVGVEFYDGADSTDLSGQAAAAGPASIGLNLDMNSTQYELLSS